MGELILCSRPLAKFPYHLENVGINIYSLEELCYYIEKNMYLLDESFLDEELCVWIGQELEFPELGERLAAICDRDGTVAEFAECILRETGYFDAVKTGKVVMGLREMAYKSKAERGKLRADRYAAGGRLRYAVYEYRRLLAEWDGENEILCGDIWHNLGCACARMFLFEEAADCYAKAYGKNRNPQSLQECLYARACAGNVDGLVAAAKEFGADAEELSDIRRTLRDAARTVDGEMTAQGQTSGDKKETSASRTVTEWKDTYRKNCRV